MKASFKIEQGLIMIYFFRKTPREPSGIKVETWLKEKELRYESIFPYTLTEVHLRLMLKVSENGFDSLLVSKSRAIKSWEVSGLQNVEYEKLSVKQMLDFILRHPRMLHSPILFDEKRLLVGYNEEEIRTFMPRHYRQAMQTQLIQNEKVELLQASSLHLS